MGRVKAFCLLHGGTVQVGWPYMLSGFLLTVKAYAYKVIDLPDGIFQSKYEYNAAGSVSCDDKKGCII
jgi:hypothetical protein